MEFWQNIYSHFNVVAFEIFGLKVHWYGLCYVFALLFGLFLAKYFIKKDKIPIKEKELESFFLYVEVGVILGARLGYIIIYDPNPWWYFSPPWQIFNPFDINGTFIGIAGFSYHGAVIGAILATLLFCKRYKKAYTQNLLKFLDLTALSVPLAYTIGRVGNFLNQELFGRPTDVAWGIYVNGILRHPSQLYEAFLEGIVVFLILNLIRKRKKFTGELALAYAFSYSLMRFVAEFWREPDPQLGFVFLNLSMGQILSFLFFAVTFFTYIYFRFKKS